LPDIGFRIENNSAQLLKILKQHNRLLPTHCFLVTLIQPSELRPIARSNQKVIYNLLFKSSAAPFQKLAKDPRFFGGDIGMMGGPHTWQRDMRYYPHVHFTVPVPPFASRVDPNAARLAFHCDGFNGCGIAQAEFHIDAVRRFKAG
jgi:hypothetical protein